MAGNIIPAIATTNAVISGLIVLQALHLLRANQPSTSSSSLSKSKSTPNSMLRTVHLQHKPAIPLQPSRPEPPNEKCGVCRDTFVDVRCDPGRVTLGGVVNAVLKGVCARVGDDPVPDVSVYEDKRILADPDFDDNLDRTLEDLNCGQGKFITIVDEDGEWGTIAAAVGLLPYVTHFHCA